MFNFYLTNANILFLPLHVEVWKWSVQRACFYISYYSIIVWVWFAHRIFTASVSTQNQMGQLQTIHYFRMMLTEFYFHSKNVNMNRNFKPTIHPYAASPTEIKIFLKSKICKFKPELFVTVPTLSLLELEWQWQYLTFDPSFILVWFVWKLVFTLLEFLSFLIFDSW